MKSIYTNGNSIFPSQVVSDAEKASWEYGEQVAQAIEQEWFSQGRTNGNRYLTTWNNYNSLRLYARVEQPTQKYKDELSINGDLSYLNLDWKPVPIVSKFVDILTNGISNKDYKINAFAQDPASLEKRTNYAEMLAQDGMSTKWDDILPMLDNEELSEQLRLAAHIIFRASLILEVLEKSNIEDQDSEKSNLVYNTMLMMDAVEVANLKGYLPNLSKINFTRIKGRTSSIKTAIKKEKIIDTIRELAQKNPDKRITWLRKKASSILSNKGQKGYSYRQILRDTKGLKIK